MSDNSVPNPLLGDEEEFYEADIRIMEDEDGVEHTFELLDTIEYDGEQYVAFAPYSEDAEDSLEEDAELVIMRVSEEDGEEVFDIVMDDDELYEVGQVFLKRLAEIFDVDGLKEELEK